MCVLCSNFILTGDKNSLFEVLKNLELDEHTVASLDKLQEIGKFFLLITLITFLLLWSHHCTFM